MTRIILPALRMLAALAGLLALLPLGDAAAQIGYGQCQDRARDRLDRDQRNPTIGLDRARSAYQADMQECVRIDARERARDVQQDDQQRLDQQREQQQRDQQRLDQQRQEQQRQQYQQRNRR
jgi:Skp family chaperone for outer membrane proteins